jgi:hypothetical protein
MLDGLTAGRVAGVKAVAIPQNLVYGPGAPLFFFISPRMVNYEGSESFFHLWKLQGCLLRRNLCLSRFMFFRLLEWPYRFGRDIGIFSADLDCAGQAHHE